jgi:hypothetical protein
MDEMETLAKELRDGARQRGLRILEAAFPGDPVAILNHQTTSVADILDLAHHSFAPFITITTTYLERDDIESIVDEFGDPDEVPAEVLGAIAEHVGEADRLMVQWLSGGGLFVYLATPVWREDIDRVLDEWRKGRAAQNDDTVKEFWIRVTHLADQLELNPAYRAANSQLRRSVGADLLEPMLRQGEGHFTVRHVLDQAGRCVRDNSAGVYAELEDRIDNLAKELRQTDAWGAARRAPDATAVARAFLIEQADGYAPTAEIVDRLRHAAGR